MAFYPREVIDQINDEVQVLELMERMGESTKGKGKTVLFLCPICNGDWNNSRINTIHNYFKCYRCASMGNRFQGKAVNYIQGKLGYNFVEAIEFLINLYSLDIQVNQGYSEEELKRFEIYNEVVQFYKSHLEDSDYLLKRGVSKEIQEKVNAGYAPGGSVLKEYLLKKGYSEEQLKTYRLVHSKGLDMMYQRVVLPLYKYGKTVDFYTRRTDDVNYLKHVYMNGDEIIYGHDFISDNQDYLDIYEAPINQLVAWSKGFPIGFATGGCTKFSNVHIRFIKKKKPKKAVRIIFDSDLNGQGQKQAFEVSKLLSENNVKHQVVLLPKGMDPADVLNQNNGIERYKYCLDKAVPGEEYQAHFQMKDIPIDVIKQHIEKRENGCSNTIYSSLFF
ncbi:MULTISPECIES: CHC2 zinc finger domain-containing protein [Bacillota]|uniref:CHC2 zinc finger domain-containing protein n=1 Tax=Bacillota TaxID=1239 RepID=UPI0039EED02B